MEKSSDLRPKLKSEDFSILAFSLTDFSTSEVTVK